MKALCSFSRGQKNHPIQGSLFPLLLLLLAGFISCGTNQFTTGQTGLNVHPIKVLTKQIDPCSLVTKTQVEQILKTPLTVDQRPTGSNNNSVQDYPCSYSSSNFIASVLISLETYRDAATARTAFHSQHRIFDFFVIGNTTSANIRVIRRTISGLGDQAFLIIAAPSSMLLVQKDNGILTVMVSNYGQPISLAENQEQQLAQLAVRKM